MIEHQRPLFLIEVRKLPYRHAERQAGSDDRAGAGARDVVEVVGEAKLGSADAQDLLDLEQDLQCDHAADAAAVDREQLLGPGASELVVQT